MGSRVLRHGKDPGPGRQQQEQIWQGLQQKQAALSANGRLVVAETSGHNIFVDQPALVVQSIADVLAAARR